MLKSLFDVKERYFRPCIILVLLAIACQAYADPESEQPPMRPSEEQQKTEQQQEHLPQWFPKVLGLQFNGIYQYVPSFTSPYIGPHSFRFDDGNGHDLTHTYGAYLGSQIWQRLQA